MGGNGMSIALTHDEAVTVVHLKEAIRAMNNLVIHLNRHQDIMPAVVRQRIIEADYMLNSAEDHIINDDPEMLVTS
jgi:hypothetical protein